MYNVIPISPIGAFPIGGLKARLRNITGTTLWVHSSGKAGNDGSYFSPIASIAAAASKLGTTTPNFGDRIIVCEGHTETVITATTLALARAQVKVIGLGSGTTQPIVDFTTATTATVVVSAANVELHNLNFRTSVASLAAMITVTATGCKIRNCRFTETGSGTALIAVSAPTATTDTAAGLEITDCHAQLASTATRQWLLTAGTIDRVKIKRNFGVFGVNASYALFQAATGKSFTAIEFSDNTIQRKNTDIDSVPSLLYSDTTANTGVARNNVFSHLDTTSTLGGIDCTGIGLSDNKAIGVVDASALLLPAADDNT